MSHNGQCGEGSNLCHFLRFDPKQLLFSIIWINYFVLAYSLEGLVVNVTCLTNVRPLQ